MVEASKLEACVNVCCYHTHGDVLCVAIIHSCHRSLAQGTHQPTEIGC